MLKEYREVKSKVKYILENCPSARNSDKTLIVCFLKQFHPDCIHDSIKLIQNMPPFESITRARRTIQALGLYQSDEQVAQGRADEEMGMRYEMQPDLWD